VTEKIFLCPRCDAPTARGQEYCVECGVRLHGSLRVDRPTGSARGVRLRAFALALVAAGGTATAIWATRDEAAATPIVTALGGSIRVKQPAAETASRLATWPRGRKGWTIVLVSVPKVEGRDHAVVLAQAARDKGLEPVGILDSAGYASLRPGYWIVFQGVYDSQAEATGSLREARGASKSARVQTINQ
jgi:hypothetical protein